MATVLNGRLFDDPHREPSGASAVEFTVAVGIGVRDMETGRWDAGERYERCIARDPILCSNILHSDALREGTEVIVLGEYYREDSIDRKTGIRSSECRFFVSDIAPSLGGDNLEIGPSAGTGTVPVRVGPFLCLFNEG